MQKRCSTQNNQKEAREITRQTASLALLPLEKSPNFHRIVDVLNDYNLDVRLFVLPTKSFSSRSKVIR